MAEEPESRMLFDLRGRRKRVIQVIYVLLALIMVASLIVIGMPGGVGFNSGNSVVSQDAADVALERAENLEERIASEPNNQNAQAELVRARITAGNSLVEIDEETGAQNVTEDANAQYDLAAQEWQDYLKQTKNQPDPAVAQLVAGVLFQLSQGSTVAQFENNITDAARAQEFVADNAAEQAAQGQGPAPLGQLTTLATYQYYAQDFKAAEATRKKALAEADDETEKQQINQQLNAVEKDAERIGKVITRAKKQAKKDGGASLENPLGGLGSDTSLGGATTTP